MNVAFLFPNELELRSPSHTLSGFFSDPGTAWARLWLWATRPGILGLRMDSRPTSYGAGPYRPGGSSPSSWGTTPEAPELRIGKRKLKVASRRFAKVFHAENAENAKGNLFVQAWAGLVFFKPIASVLGDHPFIGLPRSSGGSTGKWPHRLTRALPSQILQTCSSSAG